MTLEGPMLCDYSHAPTLYLPPTPIDCEIFRNGKKTEEIEQKKLTIMKLNVRDLVTKAFKCMKTVTLVETFSEFSLFNRGHRDIRNSTRFEPVNMTECEDMVNEHRCSYGQLSRYRNVWKTRNEVVAEYESNLKVGNLFAGADWVGFPTGNCIVLETVVINHPQTNTFESPAGDIRHCDQTQKFCVLPDGLLYTPKDNQSKKQSCKLEKYMEVTGYTNGRAFIDDEHHLALSYDTRNLMTDCGELYAKTDQGVYIKFTDHAPSRVKRQKSDAFSNLYTAQLQYLEHETKMSIKFAFYNAVVQTCQNIQQISRFISLNVQHHPTQAMRELLNNEYISASTSGGLIMVYKCHPITSYALDKMRDKCTDEIPLNFTIPGED